jgi:hypothetical protein
MMKMHPGVVLSAAAVTIAVTMTMTTSVVSAYTFDPLNNMWKPSGAKSGARRSSFASSFAPHPSEVEAPPLMMEEEVIRAQYSTWAGHYHNGVNKEHGESFQQKSLVQIEYNKRTGEVSLVDHDGIITKEDYQNLMRAISTGNAKDVEELTNVVEGTATGLGVVDQDVTLGTTHFVDGEDIDPSDVIDTSSEEVQATAEAVSGHSSPSQHQTEHEVPQQTHSSGYHQPPATGHQQAYQSATESFQTYQIPQPPVEIQAQLQEQQYQQLQHIQHQQLYQHQGHSMMTHQPQMQALQAHGTPIHSSAIADPIPETTPQNGGWGFNDRRTTFIN